MELLPLLLLPLAATLATAIDEVALDMAPNSFDDQYLNCRDEMLKELPVLQRSELAKNQIYAEGWSEAAALRHKPLKPLQRRDEAIALMAYTMETDLYKEFNKAVREGGRSHQDYLDTFHFKVLHFLLTEAIGDLRGAKSSPGCHHVYRGVQGTRFTAKPGQIIRFGQFAASSLNKKVAQGFGTDTFFELHTCHGAATQDFSFMPWEEEVLIPPFETFKVINVSYKDGNYIQLRSHGVHSNHNCAWLRGSSPHRGPPSLWGLLLAALALAVATSTP